jgi:hypothetical protein
MAEITNQVDYPFGKADVQALVAAAAVTATIKNQLTHITFTAALAANMTLNFLIEGQVRTGARVVVTALSDGTARSVTPGTGALGTAEAGVINKTKQLVFEYNGTAFVLQSARQID